MLKEDIEKVLVKSFDYFKSILGQNMDIGELKELSNWIIEEMHEELEIEKHIHRNYMISHLQLSRLMVSGKYEFKDIMGNTITLRYEDETEMPSILESGTMLVWDKSKYNTTDKISKSGKNKQRTMRPYQSILKYQMPKRKKHYSRNTQIDFNKNIHNIDDLLDMCMKLKWNEKLKSLQKIRSDVMCERMNHHIMDGKQKTITDFAT